VALSAALERWRAPRAVHDPGKIIADFAASVALGGDCLPITARTGPGSRWPSCCGPATLAPTPPPTTSRPRGWPWQLPRQSRRKALIRADTADGTHEFLTWLTAPGCRLAYSAGFTITEDIQDAILKIPAGAWTPAYDGDGEVRDGAWVAEITGMLNLDGWPAGTRVIVRKERPHPGAQLRFTDIDGHRFTCFATSTTGGQLPGLELRHRRRARCEDRIRRAKDTGLRNLPLKGFTQNQIWCEIVALACELLAWMQMIALTGPGPPLGIQTAPPADLRRRRAHRLWRAPPAAAPSRTLAMDRPDHRSDRPAAGTPWGYPARTAPATRKENSPGPVEPRPPGATAGHQGTARH